MKHINTMSHHHHRHSLTMQRVNTNLAGSVVLLWEVKWTLCQATTTGLAWLEPVACWACCNRWRWRLRHTTTTDTARPESLTLLGALLLAEMKKAWSVSCLTLQHTACPERPCTHPAVCAASRYGVSTVRVIILQAGGALWGWSNGRNLGATSVGSWPSR